MDLSQVPFEPCYRDQHCVIYNADCRSIVPHLPTVDLLLTDPPYGIGERMQGGTWGAKQKYADFRNWDVAPDPGTMRSHIEKAKQSIIWGGNCFGLPGSRCWLVWRKVNAVPTMSAAELAWTTLDRPCQAIDLPVATHHYGHPIRHHAGRL